MLILSAGVTALWTLPSNAQVTSSDNSQAFQIQQNTGTGTIQIQLNGSQKVTLDSNGKLGIGTGGLQIGEMPTCDLTTKGYLQYNCGRPVFCDGTDWKTWPPSAADRAQKLYVFVTSTSQTGDLASSGGADKICQTRARAGGLPGYYRALVSETNSSFASRAETSSCVAYDYVLPDGNTVATSFTDLMDSSLALPLNITEFGAASSNWRAWTGSNADGTSAAANCSNWRTASTGTTGIHGSFSNYNTYKWVKDDTFAPVPCDSPYTLYCIQQPDLPSGITYPRIFVTNARYNGRFDQILPVSSATYRGTGIGGAHAICQATANTASLGGSWSAWMTQAGTSTASAPHFHLKQSSIPYVTVENFKIADDWTDLTDGSLDMGIVTTETGGALANSNPLVWTNVGTNGQFNDSNWNTGTCAQHGAGWTTNSASLSGSYAEAGAASSRWTAVGSATCDTAKHIYCIEHKIAPYTEYKRVFATGAGYTGNLGGVAGADAKCQAAANAASLTGDYKAWIADSTAASAPATRFTQSSGPYRMLDGRILAESWADLVDGGNNGATEGNMTALNITETGAVIPISTGASWTNVANDGTRKGTTDTCNNWSSALNTDNGHTGVITTVRGWTDTQSYACDSNYLHLYCFEQ